MMTEQEWHTSQEPEAMLKGLHGISSLAGISPIGGKIQRKLRLFAVACVRRLWPLLQFGRSRSAVELSELFADGIVDKGQLERVEAAALADASTWKREWGDIGLARKQAMWAAWGSAGTRWAGGWSPAMRAAWLAFEHAQKAKCADGETERATQVLLIRDIFGDPLKPTTINAFWLTTTVNVLAELIYNDRAYDRMPVLADALEDAGCTNVDILNHCRQPGEHVRGCWVLDLILGKQ
jgi:hypothetical protein